MSEDLLNFDDLPSTTGAPLQSAEPNTGSLIDLGPSSMIAGASTLIPGSSVNLLDLENEVKANPFGTTSTDAEQQSKVPKIDIVVDAFGAASEMSPTKNAQLPPPLIPSPSSTNPVALGISSAETSSVFPLVPNPNPATAALPSISVPEQEEPQQPHFQQHISLSSPLSTKSPSSERSASNSSTHKTVMTPIMSGSTSRLNPVPPPLLPAHLPLPTRKWTDPTCFCQVPVTDSLGEVVSKSFSHLPVNQRPQRNSVTVSQALESASSDAFLPLIASNSWYGVASLARNDLISTHPLNVDEIMRLWFLRWTALLKLAKFDIIEKEVENVKARDLKSLCYDNYSDLFPGKKGCMVSFDVLLLISKLPSFRGDAHEAIHRLYGLLYPENPWDFTPNKLEHYRILLHVVSVLIKIPDIPLAIRVASELSCVYPENLDILSMLGRLHLHLGDLDAAIKIFSKIEALLGIPAPASLDKEFSQLPSNLVRPDIVLSNRAFVLIAKDRYKEAIPYFTDLLALQPESASAINNLAMAHLYSGDVAQGSSFLESFLVTHPTLGGLRPELVFNLTSMYDLTDSSVAKKRALLKVLVQGCGDDFDPSVLKL